VRARGRAARAAIPAATHVDASHAIAQRLAATPAFAAARTLLLTMPGRGDWDTRALIAAALAAGKIVALPRVNAATRMLELCMIDNLDTDVAAGFAGIHEPLAARPRVTPQAIDWVLVPGLAFDAHGQRLGYGGGYYDRLLPALAAHRAAGAFDEQIVPAVPVTSHDMGIDELMTPTRHWTW
jgi:5-formyltetrahydrofolate cyclo-ligase